jgi:hypothetical protein
VVFSPFFFFFFIFSFFQVTRGNNRTFDAKGVEIETEQSRVIRSRVGFSSWKEEVKADPNELSLQFIAARFGGRGFHVPTFFAAFDICLIFV